MQDWKQFTFIHVVQLKQTCSQLKTCIFHFFVEQIRMCNMKPDHMNESELISSLVWHNTKNIEVI